MGQELLPLRKRSDFLSARTGEKRRGALFLLEMKQHSQFDDVITPARIGLTVSRRNGNAVCRNRIKRRLRAAIKIGKIAEIAAPATDYVIIARPEILNAPFTRLVDEIRRRIIGKTTKTNNKRAS